MTKPVDLDALQRHRRRPREGAAMSAKTARTDAKVLDALREAAERLPHLAAELRGAHQSLVIHFAMCCVRKETAK